MNNFAATLGQRQKGSFTGFALVVLKLGHLTPLLAGTGRLLSTSNTFTTRTVGVDERLKCVRCNKLFATVRARASWILLDSC